MVNGRGGHIRHAEGLMSQRHHDYWIQIKMYIGHGLCHVQGCRNILQGLQYNYSHYSDLGRFWAPVGQFGLILTSVLTQIFTSGEVPAGTTYFEIGVG